jgi:hypothetical protein
MAKPNNPLLELDAHWRPMFAHPERDHHLMAITSSRRTKSGARFRLATDNGTAAHLAITFIQPEVVRFQLFPHHPAASQADPQYVLGPYLLVAPLFSEEGHCRLYLPPGQ